MTDGKIQNKSTYPTVLNAENDRMVVAPKVTPHYTLAELLAQCSEENMALAQEDHEWLNAKPAGKEAGATDITSF